MAVRDFQWFSFPSLPTDPWYSLMGPHPDTHKEHPCLASKKQMRLRVLQVVHWRPTCPDWGHRAIRVLRPTGRRDGLLGYSGADPLGNYLWKLYRKRKDPSYMAGKLLLTTAMKKTEKHNPRKLAAHVIGGDSK